MHISKYEKNICTTNTYIGTMSYNTYYCFYYTCVISAVLASKHSPAFSYFITEFSHIPVLNTYQLLYIPYKGGHFIIYRGYKYVLHINLF